MTKIRGFEKISLDQFKKDLEIEIFDKNENSVEDIYNSILLPKRATKNSAGYDVYSPFSFTLNPNESIKIPTGIKAYMLEDEYIKIVPRSSLGFKHFIRLANTIGIGDSDYYNNSGNEGHYFVKIRNEGITSLSIKKGDAICQIIFEKFLLADNDDVENERRGGIGSTNK